MKKLLIGLLVLGTISSFAVTKEENCNVYIRKNSIEKARLKKILKRLDYEIVNSRRSATYIAQTKKFFSQRTPEYGEVWTPKYKTFKISIMKNGKKIYDDQNGYISGGPRPLFQFKRDINETFDAFEDRFAPCLY